MKGKDLFDAMGMIDDRFVEEAAPDEKLLRKGADGLTQTVPLQEKRRKWYQHPKLYVGLATAAAVVILVGVIAPQMNRIEKNGNKLYPNTKKENTAQGDEYKSPNHSDGLAGADKLEVREENELGVKEKTETVDEETDKTNPPRSENAERIAFLILENNASTHTKGGAFRATYVARDGSFLRTKSGADITHYYSGSRLSSRDDTAEIVAKCDYKEVLKREQAVRSPSAKAFDPSAVKTVRSEDLDLRQIVSPDVEEALILILEQKDDGEIKYVVLDASDPNTEEILKWYHECVDEINSREIEMDP